MSRYQAPRAASERGFLQRVAGTFGLGGDAPDQRATDDLDEWIDVTLKEVYGLDEVERDEDGDIPLPYGSSVLFIHRPDPDMPCITIFAPLLHDFAMSPGVYEAANAINKQVPLAKVTVDEKTKQITMSLDLLVIDSLSSADLAFAIELLGEESDRFDNLLKKRFGGDTMLDDDGDEFDV